VHRQPFDKHENERRKNVKKFDKQCMKGEENRIIKKKNI
jgi:hypothetical protein